jgi:putative peptidoglycan lipid II flippase
LANAKPETAAALLTDADSPDRPTAEPAEEAAHVARATGILTLGNIGSRVLGMAREIALTNLFGASAAVDAFYVATIIPKTLYDLLIAGHVNSAIIPVLSEITARDGQAALWRVVSSLASLMTALLAALTLGLVAFAPQIVALVGSGYAAPTLALAADLLRLTAPALLLLGLFAIFSGALYALRAFAWPALAGVVFNAAIVIVMLTLTPPLTVIIERSGPLILLVPGRPLSAVTAAALGWLIGALAQLLLQLPGMRGARLRPRFDWGSPAIRQIALLYLPVMGSLILDTLVVRTFSYNLASQTIEGALGYMNWATTLIQFPQGLVATAISIAILPTLSRQVALARAADAAAGGEAEYRNILGLGLRLAITLIIPAAIGLFVLAVPIVRLLFEHGEFTAADTVITVDALRLYLIGLPFAAVDLLLVYAFYARQDTLTPALIGVASLVVYMIAALALLPVIGLFSLMVADSVKHIVHALLSAAILGRRIGGYGPQRILLTLVKTGAAAGLMGAAALLLEPVFERIFAGGGTIREGLLVLAASGSSALIFFAGAYLLRIEEFGWFIRSLRQRLNR